MYAGYANENKNNNNNILNFFLCKKTETLILYSGNRVLMYTMKTFRNKVINIKLIMYLHAST